MRFTSFSTILAALVALSGLTGCGVEKKAERDAPDGATVQVEPSGNPDAASEKGPFEQIGARVDKGAKKLDVVLEKGAAELGEALERAGRELQEKSAEAERRRQEQQQQQQQPPQESEGPSVSIDINVEKP